MKHLIHSVALSTVIAFAGLGCGGDAQPVRSADDAPGTSNERSAQGTQGPLSSDQQLRGGNQGPQSSGDNAGSGAGASGVSDSQNTGATNSAGTGAPGTGPGTGTGNQGTGAGRGPETGTGTGIPGGFRGDNNDDLPTTGSQNDQQNKKKGSGAGEPGAGPNNKGQSPMH